jgi:AcrR family transcriptional regulator
VVYAGQGDARRAMALLWRRAESAGQRTGPGPKPGLSVDVIVAAAIAIADADGMSALSMRAVGERLGCTAMALYTYVANKGELIELMYDQVLAELAVDYDHDAGWRAATMAWSGDLLAFYLRHPWVLAVSQARPVLGPNEYVVLENVVRILGQTGLAGRLIWRTVSALFQFVSAVARTIAETRRAATVTGVSDEDWWFARSAELTRVAPDFEQRFPSLAALSADGVFDQGDDSTPYLEREATETFEMGLGVLLDGVEIAAGTRGSQHHG